MIQLWLAIAISAAALVVGIVVGVLVRRAIAEKKIGAARSVAEQIVVDAEKRAEAIEKGRMLEAQSEILRLRNEAEAEIKERRAEVSRQERRMQQKEDALDHKSEVLDQKTEALEQKMRENDELKARINQALDEQQRVLEGIAGLTAEEAKEELTQRVEGEVKHELAQRLDELEAQFKDEADTKARNILSLAIQRCATDHVAESTISVVQIPNEEMKGRIIGREGRNIQKLETLTGVELIIDDTPEAITLSGFDPVRREVARLTLERLIADGRIHPTRIEETVEKCRREVETVVKQAGERATYEVGIPNLHPELVKLLGRLRYRTSYGQNVLRHSVEVAFLAGIMAEELGVDAAVAKRAGLLHDIGKAFPHDMEGTHVELGVNAVRKYKESRDVVHAIEAHHNDVEPQTVIAILVQAADAISASRPGARREDLENYIKRLEKLEEIAKGFEGVEKAFAIQAGRELRVMVKPEDVSDEGMKLIARDMAKKIQDEVKYPGQIKVNLIRESRAVDYAK